MGFGKMEFKKSMIIIILTVFLLSIAGVCASDTNDTAVGDADEIETDSLEKVADDALAVSNDEEVLRASSDWYVNNSAGPDGDGSEANPYQNLKSVLDNTYLQDDDTIHIAGGTYKGSDNVDLTIDKKLKLENWGDDEVVFDGENSRRIFTVNSQSVSIKGLTFKNGNAADYGGAIYFSNSGTLINCNFTNNSARYGGAIYFYANGKVTNCNFTNNKATFDGGAIYFEDESTGEVMNCDFTSFFFYSPAV